MTTRRDVLLGGALTFYWATCSCRSRAEGPQLGCFIDDQTLSSKLGSHESGWSFDINKDPVFGGSGDKQFDQALATTLGRASDLFSILPGFAFFNEDRGPNAFASPSQRLKRSDGSVVFGQQLLAKLMSAVEHPAAGVAAVCAHEFGHILQYKRGIDRRLVGADGRVKRLELHADFLAGYFAGRRKLERSDYPAAVFANTQFTAGDNMLQNPQHHGSPEERGRAVVEGFKTAYQSKRSLDEAVEVGVQFALNQPG
jgi:hypothetical protein